MKRQQKEGRSCVRAQLPQTKSGVDGSSPHFPQKSGLKSSSKGIIDPKSIVDPGTI
jgi:hypothetical protein